MLNRPIVTWNPDMLARFKAALANAERTDREVFTFDGYEYVVSYARYLAEYLDDHFGGKDVM